MGGLWCSRKTSSWMGFVGGVLCMVSGGIPPCLVGCGGWLWARLFHFLSPGKCLGHNGDPVRRGPTLAIMGVGPFVGLTLSSKGVW